jgi:hypothetical protein
MKIFFSILLLSIIATGSVAYGKLQIPRQMNASDRRSSLEILGAATASRLLSSPYPLGGAQGFELGLSRHYVPTSFLSEYGDKQAGQKDFEYAVLTLGKGLFYDIDLFLSLVPMTQTDSITHASGLLRYQLWQSESNTFRLSAVLSASTSNLNNQLGLQSTGYDLVGTTTIDEVSFYLGVGLSAISGRFIGGTRGITDSQQTENEKVNLAHQVIGLEWPIGNFFWAAEVDRYKIPFYSLKLGLRI